MDGITPQVVGTAGFMVLDIVETRRNAPPVTLHFGGSAGNVAVILGALGWEAWPLTRLPEGDPALPLIVEDLARFNVRGDFITLTPSGPFPMRVQRKRASGSAQPSFYTRCPRCDGRFKGWTSVTNQTVDTILDRLPRFDWFFIDRYTRGLLTMARHAKDRG